MKSNLWGKKCYSYSPFNTSHSYVGHKKPHFGELHFKENLYTLQLKTRPDDGETSEAEKNKKIINLKGMKVMLFSLFFSTVFYYHRKYYGLFIVNQRNENAQRWNTQVARLRRWDARSSSVWQSPVVSGYHKLFFSNLFQLWKHCVLANPTKRLAHLSPFAISIKFVIFSLFLRLSFIIRS